MFLEPCKNHEILLESLLNRVDEKIFHQPIYY